MKLSIITSTFNAEKYLPRLIESLRQQTDKEFEWVVIDGDSADGTVELLRDVTDLPLVWRSEPDFGIYDALNKAIKLCTGEFYLVVGADDRLDPAAVANYKALGIATGADILTAAVDYGSDVGIVAKPRGSSWLKGQMAFVTGHSVGSVYRKNLHEKAGVGFYSKAYPIAADQLFIKRAVQSGARVAVGDFLTGHFGEDGVSTVNVAGTMTEFFRAQLQTERCKGLQVLLFVLRLLKNFPKLVR
ncbi:MAG: glycosyltransferase [Zoogloeaceae bacterium]|jgi:glycosyltransferase involved in cell wall biosynthesis|nr:glycosyltransferase [Zoogloeaceae bacterium]